MKNDIKGIRNISYVEEVTGVSSITVDGDGQILEELVGELRNELLRVLVGSVDVVSSGDQDRQFEGAEVRLYEELSTGLGGSIRIGRLENVFFGHGVGLEILSLSVDFIRRHVNESSHGLTALGGLEKNVSSVNVGMSEGKGVTE